jgi:hypothetical protein
MHVCANCDQPFSGDSCPACGLSAHHTPTERRKIKYRFIAPTLVSFAGAFGAIAAFELYPPVDRDKVLFSGIAIFAAAAATHIARSRRPHHAPRVGFLKKLHWSAATVMVLFALLVYANGALDRHPPRRVDVTVVEKNTHRGRHGDSYSLDVAPSWRPGHSVETLTVSAAEFSSVHTDGPAHLTVHQGALGLSWYDGVNAW